MQVPVPGVNIDERQAIKSLAIHSSCKTNPSYNGSSDTALGILKVKK